MTKLEKSFGNFEAIIEPNEDRPGVSCYVTQGNQWAISSLAMVQAWGEIDTSGTVDENGYEYIIEVPDVIVWQITAWAEDNGY